MDKYYFQQIVMEHGAEEPSVGISGPTGIYSDAPNYLLWCVKPFPHVLHIYYIVYFLVANDIGQKKHLFFGEILIDRFHVLYWIVWKIWISPMRFRDPGIWTQIS